VSIKSFHYFLILCYIYVCIIFFINRISVTIKRNDIVTIHRSHVQYCQELILFILYSKDRKAGTILTAISNSKFIYLIFSFQVLFYFLFLILTHLSIYQTSVPFLPLCNFFYISLNQFTRLGVGPGPLL
jgi:hypothetical protein